MTQRSESPILKILGTPMNYITLEWISDMRKALSRDIEKKSMVELKNPVKPEDVEFWQLINLFLFYFILLVVVTIILHIVGYVLHHQ